MPIPVRWSEAPEVQAVADRLIPLYHVHLQTFDAEIRYVFRSEIQRKETKEIWGKAHLVTGMNAYLAQPDASRREDTLFVLEIAKPIWDRITPSQQEALVDHELEHFQIEVKEDGTLAKYLLPHSIEEFDCIVARHGAWRPDIVRFAKALSAGPDAAPPASDALVNLADGEIEAILESVRLSNAQSISDALRRARGR
jgi:hypothetical protein